MQDSKVKSLAAHRLKTLPYGSQQVAGKPRLLDQVREASRARHYSYMTEKAYIGWIRRFIYFHDKQHPAKMGEHEIARFLSSLATERRVSASTQNQALNSVLFLYREVLGTWNPAQRLRYALMMSNPELDPTDKGSGVFWMPNHRLETDLRPAALWTGLGCSP